MEKMLDAYIRHLRIERNLSPFTVRNYSSDILEFLEFIGAEGVTSLEVVDHFLIRRYLAGLRSKGIANASISRKMSSLRSFFQYLHIEGKISVGPLSKISLPKQELRLPKFLSSEEILALLSGPEYSTPQGIRDLAILELLYAAGLRVSETVSLDVGSIDMETRQMRVLGKGSKERMVLIGEPAAAALSRYLDFGRTKLLGAKQTKALFLNRYGDRIAERRIQYIIKKYAEVVGIERRVFPHMLRHTFATHMLDGGADLRVLQELLGHSNLSTTQIYTHVTRSQMRTRYLEAHPRSRIDERGVRPADSRDSSGQ